MFPTHIDNVMRSTYIHCGYKAMLRHVRHLVPAQATNIHLHFGGCYARGLEIMRKAFYVEGLSPVKALAAGERAITEMWGDFEVPEKFKGHKDLDRCIGALRFYASRQPITTDFITPWVSETGEHAIEFKFSLPLPDLVHPETGGPIHFCGRTDMIGVYGGQLFIEDDKTTTSLGEQWVKNWDLDSQPTGYCWAARSLGYPVAGAIIRGVSVLSSKFDKKTGEYLEQMSYGYAHAIVQRPAWMISRWLEEVQDNITDMIRDYTRGRWRKALDKDSCNAYGGCPYREICHHEDPEPWIEQYYKIDVWSPLHEIK